MADPMMPPPPPDYTGAIPSPPDAKAPKATDLPPDVPGRQPAGMLTVPEMVGMAPALIPGEGIGMALARPAISAAMRYGAEKLAGATQPGLGAAESGFGMLAGEVLGGIGRATSRVARKWADRTAERVADLIAKAVPEFGGKTPAETFNTIVGGGGMEKVSASFGKRLRAIWDKAMPGNELPEGYISEQVRQQIDDLAKNLWPAESKAEWTKLNADYAKAKNIEKWVKSPKVKALFEASGNISVPALQEAFVKQRAKVARAVPGIEEGLRMPLGSTERDIPGQGLRFGGHVSAYGYPMGWLKSLPRAPRMAQEGMTPEMVARALRTLGSAGVAAGTSTE